MLSDYYSKILVFLRVNYTFKSMKISVEHDMLVRVKIARSLCHLLKKKKKAQMKLRW